MDKTKFEIKKINIFKEDVEIEEIKLNGIERIWIIGDVHFGVKNNSDLFLKIQKEYFYNVFFDLLKNSGAKRETDIIVFLGDIYDNRHSIQLLIMNESYKILNKLSDEFDVYIIAGNHDLFSNNNNEISSLLPLENIKNVKIFKDKIGLLNFTDVNKKFLLKPWHNFKESEDLFLNEICNLLDIDFVSTHTNFTDKSDFFLKDIRSLDHKIIKRPKYIFNGHIHRGSFFDNVINCGSLFSFDFGDINSKKFFVTLDLKTNEIKKINNDYSPEFTKFKLDDLINLNDEELFKKLNNKFFKIYVDSSKFKNTEISIFNEKLEKILNFFSVSFVFVSNQNMESSVYLKNDNGEVRSFNVMGFFDSYINFLIKNNENEKNNLLFSKKLIHKIYDKIKSENENKEDQV